MSAGSAVLELPVSESRRRDPEGVPFGGAVPCWSQSGSSASQQHGPTDRRPHKHTHTVFRCVRRVSGSSADLRCVPCFTPSLPGKHGRSSVPDPLLSHAEHTPSGWTCPRSPTAAAGCCAPTAACTPRRLTHTLTRGFVCASAAPTFIVRQETNPRVLTPALFPLKSPPHPPAPRAWTPQPHW